MTPEIPSISIVSIHALLTECDPTGSQRAGKACRFNPRTPYGVRQSASNTVIVHTSFQSTHSLRSATDAIGRVRIESKVSIHALLTECDVPAKSLSDLRFRFNPRTPYGVRRNPPFIGPPSSAFQSTHSLRSATVSPSNGGLFVEVSIHALLTECDNAFFSKT